MTYSPVTTQPQAIVLPAALGGAWRLWHERHERAIALAAFVSGFVLDLLTLPRVDSWLLRYEFQHGGKRGTD
jgi:hypothetical protein